MKQLWVVVQVKPSQNVEVSTASVQLQPKPRALVIQPEPSTHQPSGYHAPQSPSTGSDVTGSRQQQPEVRQVHDRLTVTQKVLETCTNWMSSEREIVNAFVRRADAIRLNMWSVTIGEIFARLMNIGVKSDRIMRIHVSRHQPKITLWHSVIIVDRLRLIRVHRPVDWQFEYYEL